MDEDSIKQTLSVLQANSLRALVDSVNRMNYNSPTKILKEDIVDIIRQDDTYFLIYYT